jgi:trehalose-6-phosphate synthase
VFPISIDVCPAAAQAASADGTRHMGRLRQSVGNRTLMIGVDRLEESSYDAFAVVAQDLELFAWVRPCSNASPR